MKLFINKEREREKENVSDTVRSNVNFFPLSLLATCLLYMLMLCLFASHRVLSSNVGI